MGEAYMKVFRHLFCYMLVLGFIIIVLGCGEDSSLYKKGRKHQSRKEYKLAIETYDHIISVYPVSKYTPLAKEKRKECLVEHLRQRAAEYLKVLEEHNFDQAINFLNPTLRARYDSLTSASELFCSRHFIEKEEISKVEVNSEETAGIVYLNRTVLLGHSGEKAVYEDQKSEWISVNHQWYLK